MKLIHTPLYQYVLFQACKTTKTRVKPHNDVHRYPGTPHHDCHFHQRQQQSDVPVVVVDLGSKLLERPRLSTWLIWMAATSLSPPGSCSSSSSFPYSSSSPPGASNAHTRVGRVRAFVMPMLVVMLLGVLYSGERLRFIQLAAEIRKSVRKIRTTNNKRVQSRRVQGGTSSPRFRAALVGQTLGCRKYIVALTSKSYLPQQSSILDTFSQFPWVFWFYPLMCRCLSARVDCLKRCLTASE